MPPTARLTERLTVALGRGSAYLDLADAMRGLVLDGELVVGDRLPSERRLADSLGVSRTTVTAALTVLRGEGYLHSRQGSGTVITLPPDRAERPDEADGRPPPRPGLIDLTIAAMPAPAALAGAATRAAARLPAFLADAGLHPLGLPELRAGLARRLTRQGLPTEPAQLIITQGALHAWDLTLRALTRPGTPVVVEQPTYPAVVDAARAHHVALSPLAVRADGWSLPPRTAATPALVHVVPDFQNPTGHLADEPARRAMVRSFRGATVFVDETFAALRFGPAITPTAALGRDVLTAGSLSKHVWGGLRIGWLRGPQDVVARLGVARTAQDLAPPVVEQLIALELLDELDELAAARAAGLRARRDYTLQVIDRAGWRAHSPAGGMCLWVDLGGLSSTRLARAALEEGVRVIPGPRFSLSGTHDRFLRLGYCAAEPVLDEAIGRLVHAAARGPVALDGPTPQWTA